MVSESDRKKIVDYLEERNGGKLTRPLSNIRKYYVDTVSKHRYIIIVSTGDWHGIPEDVIKIEQAYAAAGTDLPEPKLILGRRLKDRIEIYQNSFTHVMKNLSHLSRAKTGNYEFHTRPIDGRLSITELDGFYLFLLGRIDR